MKTLEQLVELTKKYYVEKKAAQIAEKLEISVKTVENQMGKAIKHIREFVKQHPNIIVFFKIWYFSYYIVGVLKEFVFYLKEV